MRTIAILLTTLFFLGTNLTAQEKDLADLLYEAIYAEEITGELDQAKSIYEGILKTYPDRRQECAQAIYHLGLIAERAGKQEGKKAESYYTELINNYQEIGEYASLARNRMRIIEDKNTFIDPRDGHKYKYVELGNQTWMAENLAYMPWVNPPKKQEFGIWVYDYDGHDVAEAKATENYQKYGCLYDWTTAMDIDPGYLSAEWNGDSENHQGICPPGWRVPSDEDWTELEMLLGLTKAQIKERDDPENWNLGFWQSCGASKLKSTSGWLSGGNGNNDMSFNYFPGGNRYVEIPERKTLQDIGIQGTSWTSSEYTDSLCDVCFEQGHVSFSRFMVNQRAGQIDDNIYRSPDNKTSGFSLRCIKSSNPKQSDKKESYRKIKIT